MQISTWLERAVVGCLFIIAVFAPHSIAVTQAAWLLGMAFWLARLAIYPRPSLFRSVSMRAPMRAEISPVTKVTALLNCASADIENSWQVDLEAILAPRQLTGLDSWGQ